MPLAHSLVTACGRRHDDYNDLDARKRKDKMTDMCSTISAPMIFKNHSAVRIQDLVYATCCLHLVGEKKARVLRGN